MGAAPDQQEPRRLVLTCRDMTRIVARRYGALCVGFALFGVLGGAIGLASESAGAKTFGAVVFVAFLVLCAVLVVHGRAEVRTEFPRLPVIEATPQELRLVEPSGETFRVPRDGLVSVVRLTAPGIRGSRIQFRDAAGRTVAHWDVFWIAPLAMRWIGQLGYPTSTISGQAAVKAAYPDDDIDGDGARHHGRS